MKYQSELIKDILEERGHEKSSLHYESECIETWIEENKGSYPKLCDYQGEWLNYIVEKPIGVFPYVTIIDVTEATVNNVVPFAFKSAILKGNTEVIIVGKNLFNGNLENGGYSQLTGLKQEATDVLRSVDFIKVEPSSTICCSNNGIARATHIFEYDENKKFLKFNDAITKVTLLPSTKYVTFFGGNRDRDKMQIEYGTEPTDYEECRQAMQSVKMPGLTTSNEDGTKTNILTVNEEVELRGIGDVKDELDLMTGEVVERVGEVVLNGSESWGTGLWGNQVEGIGFETKIKNDVSPSVFVKAISNKLLYGASNNFQNDGEYFDMVGAGNGETWIRIRILRSKLSTEDVEGFKKWLSQNNVKILYELSDKPIKTVALTVINQNGETLSKITPIEGTMNITTNGTPIKPTVSMEIPVEATNQNLMSFIEEE